MLLLGITKELDETLEIFSTEIQNLGNPFGPRKTINSGV